MSVILSSELEIYINGKFREIEVEVVHVIDTADWTLLKTEYESLPEGGDEFVLYSTPLLAVGVTSNGSTVPFCAPSINFDDLFEGFTTGRMAMCSPRGEVFAKKTMFQSKEQFFDYAFDQAIKRRAEDEAPLRKGRVA